MTKGLSLAVPYDPQSIIEAAERGKEKERLTWSCYLKTKTVCIWLVGSTTYGEGKLKFPFAGGRARECPFISPRAG
ncbi:hypothetical protein NC651_007944 [Populus alba x Populus x berolinensis]|nr:hypothetical protein NC651_007944 [Populus alba x Populus x berolinensis]